MKLTKKFYHLRSGQKVPIGNNIILPDMLGQGASTCEQQANPNVAKANYTDIGFPARNMSAFKCGQELTQKVRASAKA
jgi:hypothetical protein